MMKWKNQLTKTPYLVLFIVLIAVGVSTASALITITLSGNVIITDDLLVEGQTDVMGPIISHRTSGNSANLVIERPGGPTSDNTQFVLSHRTSDQDLWIYGFDGTTFKNFVGFDYPNYKINFPSTGDTLVIDAANGNVEVGADLTVSGDLFADGDIECNGCIHTNDISNGAAIKSMTVSGEWEAIALFNPVDIPLIPTTNSMCFLTFVQFNNEDGGVDFEINSTCSIYDNSGTWTLKADGSNLLDNQVCRARCFTWN